MDWTAILQSWLGENAAGTVEFITDAGGPIGWLVALHLVFIWAGLNRGMQLSLIALATLVTNSWLKIVIAEPRPFWVSSEINAMRTTGGFGMPSGHAQGAMAVWGYVSYLFSQRILLVAVFFAVLVILTGLSRVYLGVHSLAQVIVGWTIGLVCLVVVIRLWPRFTEQWSRVSWNWQWLCLVGAATVVIALDQFIVWLRSEIRADPAWLTNAQTAADRLGTGEVFRQQSDLDIQTGGTTALVLFAAGYAACGILNQRWPCDLQSFKDKATATGLMLLFTSLYFWLANNLGDQFDSIVLIACLAIAYPILCLYGAMLTALRYR